MASSDSLVVGDPESDRGERTGRDRLSGTPCGTESPLTDARNCCRIESGYGLEYSGVDDATRLVDQDLQLDGPLNSSHERVLGVVGPGLTKQRWRLIESRALRNLGLLWG